LISHVVNGDWKAGDRIPPERELCQQLGIARTCLREALKAMELVGMLDSRIGDGTYVCERSEFLSRPLLWAFIGKDRVELRDVMEARKLLEKDLAGLAAERGTEAEILAIGQTVNLMKNTFISGGSFLDCDMNFHLAIAKAAHNGVLGNAVQLLRNLMRHWIHFIVMSPSVRTRVLKQHQSIYKAIRERNPRAARRAMEAHLEETVPLVTQVIEQRNA
jgi:GntR family transcriptional repressor for pyruvate dehydrogenase complex